MALNREMRSPLSAAGVLIIGVGFGAAAFARFLEELRAGEMEVAGQSALAATSVVGLGIGAVALFQLPVLIRRARLRLKYPRAVVLGSIQLSQLADAMRRLGDAEHKSLRALPYSLTLVLTEPTIEIWGGIVELRRYCTFPRDVVVALEAEPIDQLRAMSVTVRALDGQVKLPFVVFDYGPLKAFSPPLASLASVAREWRNATQAQ